MKPGALAAAWRMAGSGGNGWGSGLQRGCSLIHTRSPPVTVTLLSRQVPALPPPLSIPLRSPLLGLDLR